MCLDMDGLSYVQLILFFFSLCIGNVFSFLDGVVNLSHNGPVVLGANITFTADLYDSYGQHPSGRFSADWYDSAYPRHSSHITGITNTTFNWTISYSSTEYSPQEYEMGVNVSKLFVFYIPYAHQKMKFNITDTLNGRIDIAQEDINEVSQYVSISRPIKHTIKLNEADHNFLKNHATNVLTFWFVDCTYYGFSTDYSFTFNYTEEKTYNVDALVVASFEEPTTTTTTTTTTTMRTTSSLTSAMSVTSTTPTPQPNSSFHSESTTNPTTVSPFTDINSTKQSVNTSTQSSLVLPKQPISDKEAELREILSSGGAHFKKRQAKDIDSSPHNDILNSFDNIVSYGCLNSTFIPPSPNKTYGYFRKQIRAKAPISNVLVKGNNWLKFGDVLELNVTCSGSPRFEHCSKIKVGVYNVTGEENCTAPLEGDKCNFTLPHYFREANVYTYIIIISNDVSKVVTPAVIRMYKESIQPQLSVIVVPVSCSLVAIIIIVFGVAYYVQSQNRYTVEVADFDFGQANDTEYKSFYERLREDISHMFTRSNDFLDHNDSVPERSKYDNIQ